MAVATSLEAVPGTPLAVPTRPEPDVMGRPITELPGRSPTAEPTREKGRAESIANCGKEEQRGGYRRRGEDNHQTNSCKGCIGVRER